MDDNKEYPYNIEFGDGRTKEEMDKMQDELMKDMRTENETEECGHCKGKCMMNARRLARMYHE